MIDVPILLADIEGIIKLVVLFIFIVGPLIGKLSGGGKPARRQTRPTRTPPPPEPGEDGKLPQSTARERLEAELAQYLEETGLRPSSAEVEEPIEEPVAAELIMEDHHTGSSLADHVRGHIDPSPLGAHADKLGEGLRQADESMERHLHQVFDHDLGNVLSEQQETVAIAEGTDASVWGDESAGSTEPSHSAAKIAAAMRNPDNFKQAIVLGEILARREF